MGYLGNAPARSFISFERQVFTIVNSQTAYTLSHSVTNENDIRLVVNNIVQEPGSGKAYTASGTTLTLSAALVNGTDEMYCVFLGRAVGTVNAPAGSVGASQLASDAVTAAKLNDDIISGQTALGATPADTDEFLVSDAGTIKRVDYSYLKGGTNTPNFHAYVSGNQSIANSTFQTVIFNVEYFDSASAYNVSDGKFTVPSGQAGKYLFTFNLRAGAWEAPRFITVFAKNGSDVSYFEHAAADSNERISKGGSIIMDLAVSDYITIKLYQTSGSAQNITGTTNQSSNFFTGMKLVE